MKVRLSPFARDTLITGITTAITVVSAVVLTRWLALWLGTEGFGAYSIARRFVTAAAPLATLSLGVALPRYLGLHHHDRRAHGNYLVAAVLLCGSLTAILTVPLLASSRNAALLLFADAQQQPLLRSTVLMLFGFSMFSLLYGFYRGRSEFTRANAWQLAAMAIGPLAIVWLLRGQSAACIVAALGGVFLCSLPPLLWVCAKAVPSVGRRSLRAAGRELVTYGVPRIPEGIAWGTLLGIGPFLAPRFGSISDAGFLSAGLALFKILDGAVAGVGVVALPHVARQVSEPNGQAHVATIARDLVMLATHLGLFVAAQAWVWSDVIILTWLGADYRPAVPFVRILALGMPAYLAYTMLCSTIDAIEVRAVNTLNVLIGLGSSVVSALCLCLGLGLGAVGLSWATVLGFWVVGALSVGYLWRRFRLRSDHVLGVLAANVVCLAISWCIRRALSAQHGLAPLAVGAATVCGLAAVYLAVLWRLRVGWIDQLRKRVRFL